MIRRSLHLGRLCGLEKLRPGNTFAKMIQRRSDMNTSQPPDAEKIANLRKVAVRMDSAFRVPGTGIRFGWDSILGLVPGVGDALAFLPSVHIMHQSHRMGAPKPLLARMALNTGIDLAIGSVPLIGDIFDIGWKSKLKNVDLLEQHLQTRHRT